MSTQTAMELGAAPGSARLMLLDTYGLVYRAFFALPALTTTRGVHINAAYGFTMMVNKIIADEKPTHVIAAFDKGLPAARIALYPLYKAQRSAPAADTLGAASERALLWRIDRTDREGFDVTLPQTPGRYVVSVLKVSDDGDVGAATLAIDVR